MFTFFPAKEKFIFLFFQTILSLLSRFFQNKNIQIGLSFRPITATHTYPRMTKIFTEWSLIWHGKITDGEHLAWLINEIKGVKLNQPNLQIIISTYMDEYSRRLIGEFKDSDFQVAYCEDVGTLEEPLPKSICQQIETFNSGLQLVNPNRKVVKLRLDQTLNNSHFISIFDFYSKTFNNQDNTRIFTTSFNTFRHRACSPSDMLMFGDFTSMSRYWAKITPKEYLEAFASLNNNYRDPLYGQFVVPEVFLACKYLEKLGLLQQSSKSSHFELFSNHIGIVDSQEIGFSWYKFKCPIVNNFHSINPFFSNYSEKSTELTHLDWLIQFVWHKNEIDLFETIL